MVIEQDSFAAGLDLISPDVQVSTTGYVFAINSRSRYAYVEPVTQPVLLNQAPSGLKQGIIAIGNAVVMFVAGKAWYKLYTTDIWTQVPNFTMDASVSRIYAQSVPASSLDYVRKLNSTGNASDAMLLAANSRIAGMPSGIVCQDGINQPLFIFFNEQTQIFNARGLGTFATWTQANPEYVPIGLQMMYLSAKLFIVSADGSQVYQSITGQPLNFMLNVDINGNKAASESAGGAVTTSFAFDYDPITCLQPVNIADSFIYATKNTTRVYTLDYTNTIFGEPLFTQQAIINTGILNQEALIDISGDYAFANYEGLRNFNAVQQQKFMGRNSVFSKNLAKLFNGIRQTSCCCIPYNDYALFPVTTTVGEAVVVYDTMTSQWVGFDLLGIGHIIQHALINLPSEVRLYVITDNNNVYQLYSSDAAPLQPYVMTRAFSSAGVNTYYASANQSNNAAIPITEIKSQKVDLVFRDGTFDGNVYCTEFSNGVEVKTIEKPIEEQDAVTPYELLSAIQPIIEPEGERITFTFNDTPRGYKLGYLISWTNDAALMKLRLVTTDSSAIQSDSQKSATFGTKQM